MVGSIMVTERDRARTRKPRMSTDPAQRERAKAAGEHRTSTERARESRAGRARMATEAAQSGAETSEAHEEQRQCPYCGDFRYVDDGRGRGRFANHVRAKHPEETEGAKMRRAAEEKLTQLSPIAQRLYDALKRAIPKGSIEAIVSIFNRNTTSLGQDRHRFRSWIQRYGLTQDQIAQVEDELFGVEGAGTDSPGGHAGTPQIVGYMPTQGGGYQPIMVFPQAQSQPAASQPVFVTLPQSPQDARPPADHETRDLLRNMDKRFDALLEALRQPPPPREIPQPSAPMRRIPMLDEEGTILRDTAGQIIYQEVPYDPAMGAVEMLKAVVLLTRPTGPPPKEVDEEKLLLKMREQIRAEMKAEKPPPPEQDGKVSASLQKLLDDQRADLQQMAQRLNQVQHDSEIREEIARAMKPLQDQLAEVQNRSGLTDTQFALSHRERVAGLWQGFIQGIVGNVREDMRPMIVQSAVAGMKQMGIPDEVITQAVSSFGVPSRAAGALQGKVDEARSKWLRQ